MASTTTTVEAPKEEAKQEQVKINFDPKTLLKSMVDAGVHLGHQTRFWNPKMKPFIHGQRNGVYIIDLAKTVERLVLAADFLRKQARLGKNILFVGTKKQAADVIKEEAQRADSFFINQRWLGGLLTNFDTVRSSLNKLRDLESQRDTGGFNGLSKKEIAKLNREITKLNKSLGGLKKMRGKPDVIVVIDQLKESIAIAEAKKLNLNIVGVVDTNSDPTGIQYVIPANDDSIRSIRIITKFLADAVVEGKGQGK